MFLQSTDKVVGRYSIAKCGADGNVMEQYEFNNLIIPSALAQAREKRLIEVISLCSGTTEPSESDVGLEAPISGQWIVAFKDTTAGFDIDTNQPTLTYNYYAIIPEGLEITTIREFAMLDSESNLFSRALLKSGNEQLTLTKGVNEYIEIYYSVIFKLPLGAQPVKTFSHNGHDITVTSEAFSNATDIGRFDGVQLIDGIYVNTSEVPALGHTFQPGLESILAVTLKEQQIAGREDVSYSSPLVTEPVQIYDIIVKTQLGWHSYHFSPALDLAISAKWALDFGVQWAQNVGAYVKAPEMMVLSVNDEIAITSTFSVTDYNLGEPTPPEPEP